MYSYFVHVPVFYDYIHLHANIAVIYSQKRIYVMEAFLDCRYERRERICKKSFIIRFDARAAIIA